MKPRRGRPPKVKPEGRGRAEAPIQPEESTEKLESLLNGGEGVFSFNTPEFNTPEERDLNLADQEQQSTSDDDIDSKDVFVEAAEKARSRNTRAKYTIYKDGVWQAVKTSTNYNWERVQAEFGGGYFKIIARDVGGRYIASESREIAEPLKNDEATFATKVSPFASEEQSKAHTLDYLEVMKENQREAETKAREQSNSIATLMATMMQAQTQSQTTMMTLMQQSQQQFQALLMESQKNQQVQSQEHTKTMMTLLTTMLTKKDDGLGLTTTLKLLEDAKKNAKDEARETYRFVEEKAEKLAVEKAEAMSSNGEQEESLVKSLIKGFVPVISQAVAHASTQSAQVPGEAALRPDIANAQLALAEAAKQRNLTAHKPVSARPEVHGRVTGSGEPVLRPEVATRPPVQKARNTGVVKVTQNEDRLQRIIFGKVSADIGQALLSRQSASSTAEVVLQKLEKEGFTRQTVQKAFTLNDFYTLGKEYGLPDIAKGWIKEFYDEIQNVQSSVSAPPPA